jgi:hypothetical protein
MLRTHRFELVLGFAVAINAAFARDARADGAAAAVGSAAPEAPSTLDIAATGGGGGGTVGVASGYRFQVQYWPSEHVGMGAALGGGVQFSGFWGGKRFGHVFAGPTLSLRTDGSKSQAFATITAGYMQGHQSDLGDLQFLCIQGDCEDTSVRAELEGFAGGVGVGYLFGDEMLRPGVVILIDTLVPMNAPEIGAATLAITFNITVELRIH